jgi:hypothetical protein
VLGDWRLARRHDSRHRATAIVDHSSDLFLVVEVCYRACAQHAPHGARTGDGDLAVIALAERVIWDNVDH